MAMALGRLGEQQSGLDPFIGVTFVQRGQSVRHIGIRLSTNTTLAAEEAYTSILGSVGQAADHWVSRQLTQIGGVHVAKQVLACKVTSHATFVPIRSHPHRARWMFGWLCERGIHYSQAW